MLDYNPELIADALDEFRAAEAYSPLPPGGVAAVRSTVKHRRQVKAITFSVLGALVIAVPIAAFAANPRGNNSPPVAESAAPTWEPTPSPTPSPSPQAPDAKLTKEQLIAAKVAIPKGPKWPCAAQLPGAPAGGEEPHMEVRTLAYTNLDSDPALETAALVVCSSFDLNFSQVLGFDIDSVGTPVSLGVVVPQLEPHDIVGIVERDGGGVIATVDWQEESPEPGEPKAQKREFAWDGTVFKQVGGPTAFPVRVVTDLAIKADPLVLGTVKDGKRTGSLRVTVTNNGPNRSGELQIEIALNRLVIDGEPGNIGYRPPLEAGTSSTFELRVTVEASNTEQTVQVYIHSFIEDRNSGNNYVEVAINRL